MSYLKKEVWVILKLDEWSGYTERAWEKILCKLLLYNFKVTLQQKILVDKVLGRKRHLRFLPFWLDCWILFLLLWIIPLHYWKMHWRIVEKVQRNHATVNNLQLFVFLSHNCKSANKIIWIFNFCCNITGERKIKFMFLQKQQQREGTICIYRAAIK